MQKALKQHTLFRQARIKHNLPSLLFLPKSGFAPVAPEVPIKFK